MNLFQIETEIFSIDTLSCHTVQIIIYRVYETQQMQYLGVLYLYRSI